MAPVNEGREPVASVTLKLFSGKEFKTLRGSLRSLRVSSPVLVTVVVTFKFSKPSTLALGMDALMVRPGAAETATAEATRATREVRRVEENIVVKVVRVMKADDFNKTSEVDERGLNSNSGSAGLVDTGQRTDFQKVSPKANAVKIAAWVAVTKCAHALGNFAT